ncbi:peptidylprolyl isomerase, partial [Klebsiella pneumoniae]|uniref:peptidylprolyl isomerase n=1 Tax=Klebsiella pneumoniae TaxID=573 RepID=UPI00301335BE
DFRSVACQYSVDPTARGNGGDLGYRARGEFVAGVKNVDAVFHAKAGDIVGPLESPGGWYVFRVKDQRKNADGDTQVNVQGIVVASESLANTVKQR